MNGKKKLLLFMLISLLLISTLTVIVSAENTTSTAELQIKSFSLSLENAVYMNFKISYENVSPNDVKLLVWTNVPKAYEKGTEDDCLSVRQIEDGTGYAVFQYDKLAAKDMTKTVYVCAYAEVNGNAVYSDPAKFSIAMYAYQKKHASNPDTDLVALMNSMLAYGAQAQTYFNHNTNFLATDEVHMVRVANGKLSDGFALGWYQEGSQITMTANEPAEGYAFSHWENSAGAEVGTEETVTLPVTKVDTYTAVYKPLYQINVVNGTVNNASRGVFAEGSTITLVANEPADGYVFSHWTNSLGETVGTTETLTLTVTQTETYYAVHEEIIFSSKGLAFTPKADGTYSVSKGTCTDADIIIPATYSGKAVTEIEKKAFYGCSNITSVTIPDSITSIGEDAFRACVNLSDVYITDLAQWCGITFESEYGHPLEYAKNLYLNEALVTALEIPNGVTHIGNYAFCSFQGLKSVTIPDSVTSIGNHAFYYCQAMKNVTIGNNVTSVGNDAFRGCTGLTSISFPAGVRSIGDDAFGACYGLKNLTIPDTVTSIGAGAFADCIELTNVIIGNGVESLGAAAFSGCEKLASVTIGNSVTSIGDRAFYRCWKLTSITIPDSVTSIGDKAFSYCNVLATVTMGNGVQNIGASAFEGSQKLTSVYVTDIANWCSITLGNNYATPLYYAKNLYLNGTLVTDLEIPDGVTSIGNYAFYGCTEITSVTIPDSVTSIGDWTFSGTGIKSIDIPEGVRDIGVGAFGNCVELTDVTIPNGVTSIGDRVFYRCENLTSITMPNSVTSIGPSAFSGCTGLVSVTLGNGVKSIGDSAFYNCSNITSITIPDSVTSIGEEAFYRCKKLTSITIPNSVTSIGNSAFWGCEGLIRVTIGSNVTSIGERAFCACRGLITIKYRGTEAQWKQITKGTGWDTNTGDYSIIYNHTGE